MPMSGNFDANMVQPKQLGESHPVGKFPFQISNTEIVATKNNAGGMFVVHFNTPAGNALFRYNLWYEGENKDKVQAIAGGQLSALCHATGIFRLQWENDGAALRGGRGMIEVGYQKGQEPTPDNSAGGYTEIKKVFDINGNEPGKAPQASPQTQQQPQGNGGWNNQQPQQNQPQQEQKPPMTQPGGWGQPSQQQQPSQADPPWKR